MDYRQLRGRFDRVVSVGMMEHVGVGHFDEYFGQVRDLLNDDGFAFIHCIGRNTPPAATGPFIRKYIFPGGYVPALSEVFAAIERNGLWTCDAEILRLHYYYTIRHWRERFALHRAEAVSSLRRALLSDVGVLPRRPSNSSFCMGRRWSSNFSWRETGSAIPITRDFIFDAERAVASIRRARDFSQGIINRVKLTESDDGVSLKMAYAPSWEVLSELSSAPTRLSPFCRHPRVDRC